MPTMKSQTSHYSDDALDALISPPDFSEPATPAMAHATIPDAATNAISDIQASRVEDATAGIPPPPSTQVHSVSRAKTRTPTPSVSQISTPPPTVEMPGQSQTNRLPGGLISSLSPEEINNATPDELKAKVAELQGAFQEAKMSAAHHKLQYQMLSQESAAAIERMAVEARMTQYENDVIHHAEQAKSKPGAHSLSSANSAGLIPVQKDLYQQMVREIQLLRETTAALESECTHHERTNTRLENDNASLSDKVTLMRERIRENREHLTRHRRAHATPYADATPRSLYSTPPPRRSSDWREYHAHHPRHHQTQPFAALLQASELLRTDPVPRPSTKKSSHTRNTHSLSSLLTTPSRHQNTQSQNLVNYTTPTPTRAQQPFKIPATAPVPRTSNLRTPDLNIYRQRQLPVSTVAQGPASEGTVSASSDDDEAEDGQGGDSEAETVILEDDPADEVVTTSFAARAAGQMLRSPERVSALREGLGGRGMLGAAKDGRGGEGGGLRQTKLFGAVTKRGLERGVGGHEERPTKRKRTGAEPGQGVGLGISGTR